MVIRLCSFSRNDLLFGFGLLAEDLTLLPRSKAGLDDFLCSSRGATGDLKLLLCSIDIVDRDLELFPKVSFLRIGVGINLSLWSLEEDIDSLAGAWRGFTTCLVVDAPFKYEKSLICTLSSLALASREGSVALFLSEEERERARDDISRSRESTFASISHMFWCCNTVLISKGIC